MSCPLPSHHGHVTSDGEPPRLEITLPVPRHGGQGRGSWAAVSVSSVAMAGIEATGRRRGGRMWRAMR
jgi:hypothetical protein